MGRLRGVSMRPYGKRRSRPITDYGLIVTTPTPLFGDLPVDVRPERDRTADDRYREPGLPLFEEKADE